MRIDVPHGAAVEFGLTHIELGSGQVLEPLLVEIITDTPECKAWRYGYASGVRVQHTCRQAAGMSAVETAVFCGKDASLVLANVKIGKGSRVLCPERLNSVYWQTPAMDGFSGIEENPGPFTSWGMCGLTNPHGTAAFLAGFGEFSRYHAEIHGAREQQAEPWALEAVCHLASRVLNPGERLELPPLLFAAGPSLATLLNHYAKAVSQAMGASSQALPPSPTGWCSWYCYYGRETEADILKNLDCLCALPRPAGSMFFQIDDGWNLPYAGHPRVWGDWQPGQKFGHGMKWMVREIENRGFIPGLWLAPFSVDCASQLAQTRPGLLIQRQNPETGKLEPASVDNASERLALDLTNPESIEFVRQTFRRVFSEWGFKYIKIDFLQHALMPGIRHDSRQTPIESFRAALKVIRQEGGDGAFILCCGSQFGPAIGLCDGMRVGMDVGGGWAPPIKLPSWPDGNCCVKAAAKPAFYRHWMHRQWWVNDPDCLIARNAPLPIEVAELSKAAEEFGERGQEAKFFLTDEEAACWTRFVWMLGGFAMSSEIWSQLPADRRELLINASRPNSEATTWVDWYVHPELCLLKTQTEPLSVGAFNFSDETMTVDLPASKLGISKWSFTEKLDGTTFTGCGDTIHFPPLPPHSGQIWRLGI